MWEISVRFCSKYIYDSCFLKFSELFIQKIARKGETLEIGCPEDIFDTIKIQEANFGRTVSVYHSNSILSKD